MARRRQGLFGDPVLDDAVVMAVVDPSTLLNPGPFEFWATCEQFSSGEIIHYITDPDRAKKITYKTFARNVNLEPLREMDHPALYRMSAPDNWAISFYKSKLPNGQPIYYFDWSRIEHIFLDPEDGTPSLEEMAELARAAPNPSRQNPELKRRLMR